MKALTFIGQQIYAAWCIFWFVLPFIVTYPLQAILVQKQKWYRHVHTINRVWSVIFLRMFLAPLIVEWRMKVNKGERYIFTPNHSSYLDIPMMLRIVPGFLNFVGKSALCKVPLWGKVYEKLYISVDRRSTISSAKSYIQSVRTLEQGRSLVIFPEGTISPSAGEQLLPFKDGPFKLAIEKQVAVVPVTMPYNQKFLPDLGSKLKIRWHPLKIVLHEPIATKGMTLADLPALKEKVYQIIQTEITKHTIAHVNRYSDNSEISTLSTAGV